MASTILSMSIIIICCTAAPSGSCGWEPVWVVWCTNTIRVQTISVGSFGGGSKHCWREQLTILWPKGLFTGNPCWPQQNQSILFQSWSSLLHRTFGYLNLESEAETSARPLMEIFLFFLDILGINALDCHVAWRHLCVLFWQIAFRLTRTWPLTLSFGFIQTSIWKFSKTELAVQGLVEYLISVWHRLSLLCSSPVMIHMRVVGN